MSHITLPPAYFSLIADTVPSVNNSPFLNSYQLYVLDDDSCVYFYENSFGYSLNATVYDKSGKFTSYRYISSATNAVTNIIPFGNGFFLISLYSGAQIIIQFSNAKLNNNVPISIISNSNISTPCYGPPDRYFYDIDTKILGCAAYDPLGQDGGAVFDAEYLISLTGPSLISSGYTGSYYSPTNTDPYDFTKTSYNGTPLNTGSLTQSNSITSNIYYDAQAIYFIGRNAIGVHVGVSTDCPQVNTTNRNKTGSYAYSKQNAQNYFVDNGYNEFIQLLDSNIAGITGSYNGYNNAGQLYQRLQLFDVNNNVLDIPTKLNPGHPTGIVITHKNIFMMDVYRSKLYMAPYDFLNPLPNIHPYISSSSSSSSSSSQVKPQAINLINFHRPVSILGKYKA